MEWLRAFMLALPLCCACLSSIACRRFHQLGGEDACGVEMALEWLVLETMLIAYFTILIFTTRILLHIMFLILNIAQDTKFVKFLIN